MRRSAYERNNPACFSREIGPENGTGAMKCCGVILRIRSRIFYLYTLSHLFVSDQSCESVTRRFLNRCLPYFFDRLTSSCDHYIQQGPNISSDSATTASAFDSLEQRTHSES